MVLSSPNSCHAGCEDDQLGVVGERHAGAVDALVAQPGGMELVRVEEDDGLRDLAIHHKEVALEAKRGGELEALGVVADVEAAHDELAGGVLVDYSLDVDDLRHHGPKVLAGVVEDAAYGRVGAAHHALHPVDGAEEMRTMNAHDAAGSDEDVLGAVGHARRPRAERPGRWRG